MTSAPWYQGGLFEIGLIPFAELRILEKDRNFG